jgi:hypothetical protein
MLLPPLSLSMAEVGRREGVSKVSLANWCRQVSPQGSAVPEDIPLAENWPAEVRFAVGLETACFSEIQLNEYCRRKGLYPEHDSAWRQVCIAGQQTEQVPSKEEREQARRDKARTLELERELRRKDKALAETVALLVLRKKLNAYWGNDSEDS